MIMQPEYVTTGHFTEAAAEVKKKKYLAALDRVRFESYHEGLSAQIMHIGSYVAEEPTTAKLHSFIEEKGYRLSGKDHEIYLSDPRKSAPEKQKTIPRRNRRMSHQCSKRNQRKSHEQRIPIFVRSCERQRDTA
ncbi:MAG: GyrI-like domain-containing protein [Bacilli bacterium]